MITVVGGKNARILDPFFILKGTAYPTKRVHEKYQSEEFSAGARFRVAAKAFMTTQLMEQFVIDPFSPTKAVRGPENVRQMLSCILDW